MLVAFIGFFMNSRGVGREGSKFSLQVSEEEADVEAEEESV
jgi:hypothetical protein